jgi:two-component sensor histidine kinase/PAS domain-containing protein
MLQSVDALVDDLDRDLERDVTILRTVATFQSLKDEDWAALYNQAKAALQGRAYIVLVDSSGRQLVNTYVPYGEQPQVTGDPETVRRMAETRAPVISNLFTSLVVKKPVYNVSIPILRDNQVHFVLSLGLLPGDLTPLLADQGLGPQRVITIWDANSVILARSRDNERFVGMTVPVPMRGRDQRSVFRTSNLDDTDVLQAVARSRIANWTVAVNVPYASIVQAWRMSLLIWMVATILAVAFALALGVGFARLITRPLAVASAAAAALGRGEPVTLTTSYLKEAALFLRALAKAQGQLADRTAQLRESEARLAAVLDQMPCGVGLMDHEGRWIIANAIMRRFVPQRLPSRDPQRLLQWKGFDAEGRPVDPSLWPGTRALRGESAGTILDFIYTTDEGKDLWVRQAAAPFRDSDGKVTGAVVVVEDITEEKRSAEKEKMLARELQHRSNNLLSVVQAIAQLSLSDADTVAAARTRFEARLQALTRAYGRLRASDWSGVGLAEVVRSELEPYATHATIEGPDVSLGPQQVQDISLVVHELATNAVKYGSLSTPAGNVNVSWQLSDNGGALKFRWQEGGGPAVVAPTRQGFGTLLIKTLFRKARFAYASDGFSCEIELPTVQPEPDTRAAPTDPDQEAAKG